MVETITDAFTLRIINRTYWTPEQTHVIVVIIFLIAILLLLNWTRRSTVKICRVSTIT